MLLNQNLEFKYFVIDLELIELFHCAFSPHRYIDSNLLEIEIFTDE